MNSVGSNNLSLKKKSKVYTKLGYKGLYKGITKVYTKLGYKGIGVLENLNLWQRFHSFKWFDRFSSFGII